MTENMTNGGKRVTLPRQTVDLNEIRIGRLDARLGDKKGPRSFTLTLGSSGGSEFRIAQGERALVTGESGTGKTLLLEVLALLKRPVFNKNPDNSWYGGKHSGGSLSDLWIKQQGLSIDAFRGEFIGFVPQTGGLLPYLSAEENIKLPLLLTGKQGSEYQDTVKFLMRYPEFGLKRIQEKRPMALSVGQQQRVALARAIVHKPCFVIADEPTSALDSQLTETIAELLKGLSMDEEMGMPGVILSTHDARVMDIFCPTKHFVLENMEETQKVEKEGDGSLGNACGHEHYKLCPNKPGAGGHREPNY